MDLTFLNDENKRRVKLDCGGRYWYASTKEELLEFIKDHFNFLAKKYWQQNYSFIRYLEKNYFNDEFNPTKAEAKKLIDEDTHFYRTMLGCTALDLFYWYAKFGKESKEPRNLFNIEVEQ